MNKKILSVSAMVFFIAGLGTGNWLWRAPTDQVDFSEYLRTWEYIKKGHVNKNVTDKDLFYGSIQGMVEALDDPYSSFLEPTAAEIASTDMQGSFTGIGAMVDKRDGNFVIIAPLDGSPAKRAGILAGDIILAVDDESVARLKFLEVIKRIRGPEGSTVKLTISREGTDDPFDVNVVRDTIETISVKWETKVVKKKTLMILKISGFHKDTALLVRQAANEAIVLRVDGIVLDLRNNPGGLLQAAINVSCNWASGVTLVIVEPRDEKPTHHSCQWRSPLSSMPTVVLTNKGSASASEIVTGALQDHGKAYVIGETTYGKGSGQSVFNYPSGAQLRLTTFLWKTPKGRSINETGLKPDEELKADPKDLAAGKDVQMDRAIGYLTIGR